MQLTVALAKAKATAVMNEPIRLLTKTKDGSFTKNEIRMTPPSFMSAQQPAIKCSSPLQCCMMQQLTLLRRRHHRLRVLIR